MPRRRLARALIATVLALLAVWIGASFVALARLTSRPSQPATEVPPRSSQADVRASRIRTRDGEELGLWHFAPEAEGPSVLLLHCSGGSRTALGDPALALAARGLSVLVPTLRAHGDSTGDRNDFGWSSRHDVAACVEELERRRPGRPIVLVGSSLGAAAALFAAPELGARVHGYVLESLYADLPTAAENRFAMRLPEPLVTIACAGLRLATSIADRELLEIDSVRACRELPMRIPVLLLAGSADLHARLEETHALAAALGPRVETVVFEGAGHAQLFRADAVRWCDTVTGFVSRVTAARR